MFSLVKIKLLEFRIHDTEIGLCVNNCESLSPLFRFSSKILQIVGLYNLIIKMRQIILK